MKLRGYAFAFCAAVVMSVASAAYAGDMGAKNMGESHKVVTYENGKKITIVYKPVGTRTVGMVGGKPYPVLKNMPYADGGAYYTHEGLPYFAPSQNLAVKNTGRLND